MASNKNQHGALEEVYAQALFELAQEKNEIDEVAQQMADVAELVRTQPDLLKLLAARNITAAQRAGVIERVFKGQVSELVFRFLNIVNEKERLGSLAGICDALVKRIDTHQGKLEVQAFVPSELDAQQQERLATNLGQKLNKKVQMKQHVDGRLIGGLKLRVDDQLIDASVATQLRMVKQALIARGREQARKQAQQLIAE